MCLFVYSSGLIHFGRSRDGAVRLAVDQGRVQRYYGQGEKRTTAQRMHTAYYNRLSHLNPFPSLPFPPTQHLPCHFNAGFASNLSVWNKSDADFVCWIEARRVHGNSRLLSYIHSSYFYSKMLPDQSPLPSPSLHRHVYTVYVVLLC